MKPSKIVWAFVALLVTTVCHGEAERRQVGHADPTSYAGTSVGPQTADHGGKIDSKYDGFSHETICD